MVERLADPVLAREWCRRTVAAGATLGFVPTMGALHEGHLTLVRRARAECARVCVSIFVNPLQFNDARDFARYPRKFESDAELLASAGCDMVFTGSLQEFFPEAENDRARIELLDPGASAAGLEGAFRPGHFAGVATIVARLFEIVRPTRAYFGAKDFQQSLVVRDLARARGAPQVVVCETSREPGGLARSSRNELLDAPGRDRASAIYQALRAAREQWRAGERDPRSLARGMHAVLGHSGLEVEYAEVRDPEQWTGETPLHPLERAVALIAARAGSVRLIDNLRLDALDGAR